MTTPKVLLSTLVTVLSLGMVSLAFAAECPYRGTLDSQYCDRNRDLVADLPLDESQWMDPDTIIFSYTPVEDPAVYAKVWDDFINHMAKVTVSANTTDPRGSPPVTAATATQRQPTQRTRCPQDTQLRD